MTTAHQILADIEKRYGAFAVIEIVLALSHEDSNNYTLAARFALPLMSVRVLRQFFPVCAERALLLQQSLLVHRDAMPSKIMMATEGVLLVDSDYDLINRLRRREAIEIAL